MPRPSISVVVAGARRRALLATLRALGEQADAPAFHVIVVLDGPDEETATAIVRLSHPFETMLLEQSRRGLSHARDLGASAARGNIVLFADEGALAEPGLLAALHTGHADGTAVLQPGIAVGPGSPPTVVLEFAERWVARRRSRLDDGQLRPSDLCSSPLSMTTEAYAALRERVGPPGFSRTGIGEDFRLGYALNALGIRADLMDRAGCSLVVTETIGELLALSHEIGGADAELADAAPATAAKISAARAQRWTTREDAARSVAASPERAAVETARSSAALLAEARRGVLAPNAIARLDSAVALAYWLGHGGHPRPPEQPA